MPKRWGRGHFVVQQIDLFISCALLATAINASLNIGMNQRERFWRGPYARYDLATFGLVTVFILVGVCILEPTPLHDHLTFIQRTDCAQLIGKCDVSEGVWGKPTYHILSLLLQLIPYRLPWVLGMGVVLTGVCLLLIYSFTVKLAENMGLKSWARQGGLWAVVILILHPGVHRVAGAGSFWPLTMCFLFGAGVLFLESRKSPSALEYIGAAALFALAMGGQKIILVLTPLAVLAPWFWPTRFKRPRYQVCLAALPIVYSVTSSVGSILTGDAPSYSFGAVLLQVWGEVGNSGIGKPGHWLNLSFMTWSVTILVAGSFFVVSRHRQQLLPPLYALLALTTVVLGVVGPATWFTYPDIYIKHFPGVLLGAPPAAIAIISILQRLPRRFEPMNVVGFVVLLAGASLAREDAVALLTTSRVMEREIKMISQALDTLPPHDTLLIQEVSPPPKGMDTVGDPLVAWFPRGEYHWVFKQRGVSPARIETLLWAIEEESGPLGKTLLYIGSTLRSFYGGEMEAGMVPPSFERPELVEFRKHFRLESVKTFRISTLQPLGPVPLSERPAADKLESFELGFYWAYPHSSRKEVSRLP